MVIFLLKDFKERFHAVSHTDVNGTSESCVPGQGLKVLEGHEWS